MVVAHHPIDDLFLFLSPHLFLKVLPSSLFLYHIFNLSQHLSSILAPLFPFHHHQLLPSMLSRFRSFPIPCFRSFLCFSLLSQTQQLPSWLLPTFSSYDIPLSFIYSLFCKPNAPMKWWSPSLMILLSWFDFDDVQMIKVFTQNFNK